MPKVSFRMASVSCESVFGVQTSTARKNHRSGPPRASEPAASSPTSSPGVRHSSGGSGCGRFRRLGELRDVVVLLVVDDGEAAESEHARFVLADRALLLGGGRILGEVALAHPDVAEARGAAAQPVPGCLLLVGRRRV